MITKKINKGLFYNSKKLKKMEIKKYKICKKCVMDTSDSMIEFDHLGVCDHCRTFDKEILPIWKMGKGREKQLSAIVNRIKKAGSGL